MRAIFRNRRYCPTRHTSRRKHALPSLFFSALPSRTPDQVAHLAAIELHLFCRRNESVCTSPALIMRRRRPCMRPSHACTDSRASGPNLIGADQCLEWTCSRTLTTLQLTPTAVDHSHLSVARPPHDLNQVGNSTPESPPRVRIDAAQHGVVGLATVIPDGLQQF